MIPSVSNSRETNSNLELVAIPEKVLMKQLATAATRKCSGVQWPAWPLNSGGALNAIERSTPSAAAKPLLTAVEVALIRYLCVLFMVALRCQARGIHYERLADSRSKVRGPHHRG